MLKFKQFTQLTEQQIAELKYSTLHSYATKAHAKAADLQAKADAHERRERHASQGYGKTYNPTPSGHEGALKKLRKGIAKAHVKMHGTESDRLKAQAAHNEKSGVNRRARDWMSNG
jgi:hypothetical protein